MKRIAFALASLLLISTPRLFAQDDQNLWANPGFETLGDNGKPSKWRIPQSVEPLLTPLVVTTNPHSGANCIELSPPTGYSQYIFVEDDSFQIDGLKQAQLHQAGEGDVFTLSYWHRGSLKRSSLRAEVECFDASKEKIGSRIIMGSDVSPTAVWQQQSVGITLNKKDYRISSDKEIAYISIRLEVKSHSGFGNPGSIFIDDFSLTRKANKPAVVIAAPTGVRAESYEREVELSWSAASEAGTTWEVVANGKTYTSTTPSLILTSLEPGQAQNIKVCAVKGEDKSPYTEVANVQTKAISKQENDESRMPYLRTLSNDGGNTPKTVKLFYNDLYHAKTAKFTYWLDGTEIQPNGYMLNLPQTGKRTLKIRIEEKDGQVWTLHYNLNIVQ